VVKWLNLALIAAKKRATALACDTQAKIASAKKQQGLSLQTLILSEFG
jgi:hypothetical protein